MEKGEKTNISGEFETFSSNPSVKNQRFLPPPLTQGRLWVRWFSIHFRSNREIAAPGSPRLAVRQGTPLVNAGGKAAFGGRGVGRNGPHQSFQSVPKCRLECQLPPGEAKARPRNDRFDRRNRLTHLRQAVFFHPHGVFSRTRRGVSRGFSKKFAKFSHLTKKA